MERDLAWQAVPAMVVNVFPSLMRMALSGTLTDVASCSLGKVALRMIALIVTFILLLEKPPVRVSRKFREIEIEGPRRHL